MHPSNEVVNFTAMSSSSCCSRIVNLSALQQNQLIATSKKNEKKKL
jgi:hypothetical protein